ncbi:DUF3617 domain-containing protein [Polaromonas sp. UBA4122]|uniref:DUF3617 domain-containing protein n=1 Tax=Polaromonas sp. UBA4122 TaxID=1947074 RepID=UPI0025DE58DD|nr:DUF3617 domain-containing protein [Polaromonas sp. UBA4122]
MTHHRILLRTLPALALLALCLPASAQTLKAGLWEHTVAMKSQSGEIEKAMTEMQKQLATMPPAQRKQMEQMMAAQGVGMGPKANAVKVCVTREDSARMFMPQQGGQCTQQAVQRSAGTVKVQFSCSGNPPTSGETEITLLGDTAYTGKTLVNTTAHGKPEQLTMDQSGKWLGADCGTLKPLSRAPANK